MNNLTGRGWLSFAVRRWLRASAFLLLAVSAVGSPLDPGTGAFLDTNLDSLDRLAFQAYRQGDYLEAARRYLVLLRHDITNPAAIYSLAGCFGLLGEPELAGRYLARAYRARERRMRLDASARLPDPDSARRDPDFDLVADKMAFRRALDSIARAADNRERALGERLPIAARSYLDCRVKLPLEFDPQKRYALVVGLHGHGGNHESFVELWQRFGPDPQFIFACPQAPYAVPGSAHGFSWYAPVDSATQASMRAASEEYVLDVVRLLSARYNIGDVYLLGFAQGGGLTWSTGLRNPRHFRGLIVFAGEPDTVRVRPAQFEAARRLRVFIAHGRDDETTGYWYGVRAHELLKQYDYDVSFFSYAGGHAVTTEAARRAAEWLRAPRSPGSRP